MASETTLQRLAARQHGLASRTQLLDLGFSRRQISTRTTAGRWRRAAPCVYDVVPGARAASQARAIHRARRDASTGRPGAAAVRRLLRRHDDLRMVESRLEVIVMRAVRAGNLPAPTRQFPLVLEGREVRLDLAWPDERIFVEADGFGHHISRAQFRRDRERQNAAVLLGRLPLRYTWPVARAQPDRIVNEVGAAVSTRRILLSRTCAP